KVSRRRDVDIATVSMAFAVKLDEGNRVVAVRIACGGVAPSPARARRTEAVLLGQSWDAAGIERACRELEAEFAPLSDVRGTAGYRRRVLRGLLESFFEDDGPVVSATPLAPAGPAPEGSPHRDAHLHATGRARFVDDTSRGMLETWPVVSPHAHARILRRDASAALRMEGVEAVLFAADVPGVNDVGAVRNDEPLLADGVVQHHGQPVAWVVAHTLARAREAAAAVRVEYEVLPALTGLREAIAAESFHTPANTIRRGDPEADMAASPHRLAGELAVGGQDHFYLETQACWAEPGDDGSMFVNSSTQHPSGVQAIVARVLGLPMNHVTVQCPRLGGGFGGKETQAAAPAALAALAASITGRPVRVRYSREWDMVATGKRHPFLARFEAGFDDDGLIRAVRVELFADGGCSLDLSRSIVDRALLHLDNAYFLPSVEFHGTVAKTHTVSHTAFRGFGGPQGMLVIEEILDRIARRLGRRPEHVRERNLYRGEGSGHTTHYGQRVPEDRIARVWHGLKDGSDFEARRAELDRWNREHPHRKRGLAITPVKFGISFTLAFLNQAGALVLVHRDGTVEVNHGGTEMGQGLHTNVAQIAATALDIPADRIRVMPTRTDKIPNASATAASCSTDLNGMAVRNACTTLAARLAPYRVTGRTFAEAVEEAHRARVGLSALGHYHTPGLSMDWSTGRGNPFHYFAVGAAASEVEVDGRTGMARVLRVDVLHDAGDAIHPAICRGQIEGGFVQGMGWLTNEELVWGDAGRLLTRSPDTYKVPTFADVPRDFRVGLLADAAQPGTVHGSKAVGEPPFMLAISVREAIRDAVAAFGVRGEIALASPATAEAILRAIPSMPPSIPHE
ncbi:MAG: xanthine dehydrogenase molybdopterin binding subunit, partial [Verrucomicrobia bacterium]